MALADIGNQVIVAGEIATVQAALLTYANTLAQLKNGLSICNSCKVFASIASDEDKKVYQDQLTFVLAAIDSFNKICPGLYADINVIV